MAPRFTIVMDDTPDKTYIPGDRVSGKVILDVPRKLKRKAVMLSFLGEFRYLYYTGTGNGQQVHVVGIPFFKFDQTLHPGPVNLANEKRVWTFDFKFPKEFTPFYAQHSVLPLPSSTHHSIKFDTFRPSAGIVYYLHAHCPRGRAPIISFQGSLCKPYGLQHLQFEHPAKQPPGAPEIQVVTLKGQHRNSSKLPSSIHAFGEKFRDGRPNRETHTPCI
ncbi:hypothetical protein W97_00640 [Coniosporium apollinis CBS 100218]|uniref:Arrestin-like N-terminal domain-containing protein n=1 Tax=Coniosporium apollinis (strain CBS 100218) TaxID=1168221 RepID=R7YHP2_CONA1|nr:uncharacterized protein W97_00640 [Coniosporium apollinis CBS 100218]EON61425.1 hypothetical protein W97_00640 [Coniosporium apollinis CBS 100218]